MVLVRGVCRRPRPNVLKAVGFYTSQDVAARPRGFFYGDSVGDSSPEKYGEKTKANTVLIRRNM